MVELLRTRFVPVAIDVWYGNRRQDAEGEFYRKVTSQGPRKAPDNTQGLYVFDAAGALLAFTHRHPGLDRAGHLLAQLRKGLETFRPPEAPATSASTAEDRRFGRPIPPGAVTVKVAARVLGGYEKAEDPLRKVFQNGTGEDNLWIRKDEAEALVAGRFPDSLSARIAAYHLIDNTRGEPPLWHAEGVRRRDVRREGDLVLGSFRLGTDAHGAELEMRGVVEVREGRIARFDLVAKGLFWGSPGEGLTAPPPGKYPVAIAFRLADGKDEADRLPPQGARDLRDYLR